jgi:glycosyltransferase involved in cell wall biosynthesis
VKLLVLSFYYPPDLSAGSFRTDALVKALEPYARHGLGVEVITTQPNRYADLATAVEAFEDHGWLKIRRISLPAHQSGMKDQAKAFITYAKGVRKLTASGEWDMVFATSSRLMTAALGAHVSRRIKAPLYLDIRDLFTDTMKDVLGCSVLRHLLPFFRLLERRSFRRAARINAVSAGFVDHIRDIAPDQTCRVFTNGIDPDFLSRDFSKPAPDTETGPDTGLPVILYAGNIGEGQGLHKILPDAAAQLAGRAVIHVIGNGGRAGQLKDALEQAGSGPVEMHPPVPRVALMEEYRNADILFLHLNDHPAFLKVLPSKIFEYAATGKPVLAGVAGHAADFLRREVPNTAVFAPCDADAMAAAAVRLLEQSEALDRRAFCEKYTRTTIMAEMAADILATVPQGRELVQTDPSLIGKTL